MYIIYDNKYLCHNYKKLFIDKFKYFSFLDYFLSLNIHLLFLVIFGFIYLSYVDNNNNVFKLCREILQDKQNIYYLAIVGFPLKFFTLIGTIDTSINVILLISISFTTVSYILFSYFFSDFLSKIININIDKSNELNKVYYNNKYKIIILFISNVTMAILYTYQYEFTVGIIGCFIVFMSLVINYIIYWGWRIKKIDAFMDYILNFIFINYYAILCNYYHN